MRWADAVVAKEEPMAPSRTRTEDLVVAEVAVEGAVVVRHFDCPIKGQ